MKIYDVNKEIEKYYKISMFFNRYVLILWSLVLSFIIMLIFNKENSNVLAYSNTDILTKTLDKTKVVVWKTPDLFNKRLKYIKAKLLLTNSNSEQKISKLWIWIFSDKYWIYYPMNSKINNLIFKKIKTKEGILKNYVTILKYIKKQNDTFIKPKLLIKTDKEIIEKYNLWCMDTYLNNSIFCNANKNNLINDLIDKNAFDISKSFYNILFLKLSFSKEKKCDILTQIYNNKYNLANIKDVLTKNSCDVDIFNKADIFIKEVAQSEQDIFKVWDKLPEDYDVLMQKLTQQFYIITDRDNVPDYMIYSNIKLLKKMIDGGQMDSTIATLSLNVLNVLKNKESFRKKTSRDKLIAIINDLAKWSDLVKWLNSYIKDKKLVRNTDNNIINFNSKQLISEREKVNSIFEDKYRNIFTVTKHIKYNDNTKTANIEWFINLYFKVNWTIKKNPLKISFDIKNIVWSKFDIYNLKFLNKKILNYIEWNAIEIHPDSLIDLKQQLEDKLYGPLVNNDYWKDNISICDKFRKINTSASCNNGKVSISLNNSNWFSSVTIIFSLDNDLNLKNIELNSNKFKYMLNNLLNEKINIDLSSFLQKINNLNKKNWYNYKQIWTIKKLIKSRIKKIIEYDKLKLSWLSKIDTINLNNKFKIFVWTDIKLVRKFHWYYKIFFNLQWTTFWALYVKSKNTIKLISIYLPHKDKSFIFSNIKLALTPLYKEQLNWFKVDPLNFLKEKDNKKYNEYQYYIKNK